MKNRIYIILLFIITLGLATQAYAESAQEIDIKVQASLKQFAKEVVGGEEFLKKAAGVLVFPSVLQAGLVIGGEYGEGALIVNKKTLNYYSTVAASFGWQIGAQAKSIILVFLSRAALDNFRLGDGWVAGVDGSVALIEWGTGKNINTVNISDPIAGFVFDNKGLMVNLSLEGTKFTRIAR
ncbi:MAG: hypothetical protein HQL94_06475 [Magnetococcales bacterium]|nr:hypothetical protein [Magnetococcales bacterium]MBF0439496.1 hypothetical protein [Magnetococcales bacterium]